MTEKEVWNIALPHFYYIDKREVKVAYHFSISGGPVGIKLFLYDKEHENNKDYVVERSPEEVYKTKEEAEQHLKEAN